MLVVSLSTIPPRFGQIGPTLESLLAQTAPIDEIRLYIPRRYRRFAEYDGSLPDVPKGVRIMRPEDDLGPASKVLFAADELAGAAGDILFCDDDRIYAPGWAAHLLRARAAHPEAAIALTGRELASVPAVTAPPQGPRPRPRAIKRPWPLDPVFTAKLLYHRQRRRFANPPAEPSRRMYLRSGYTDTFMGFGGVLVRPHHFDRSDWEIPPICWAVDDIWLSGALARKGVPILVPAGFARPRNTAGFDTAPLFAAIIDGAGRDDAEARCVAHLREAFGIWG